MQYLCNCEHLLQYYFGIGFWKSSHKKSCIVVPKALSSLVLLHSIIFFYLVFVMFMGGHIVSVTHFLFCETVASFRELNNISLSASVVLH